MVKQNLVIVESPTKAKTIERYLGKNFKVKGTYVICLKVKWA